MYTTAELEQEQEIQADAEHFVRQYGLAFNLRTLRAVADDIREHGREAVKAAFDKAVDSDKRGGISLKFYRACLADTGGHGRDGRDSPGVKYMMHSDDEWARTASAAVVNLDDD